jgi:maltose alpha-D-glucosyltransferase/alpha-amylase
MSKWLKDAVFYEIYPQSFQDTNSDGIGDFRGIINRLDYIKELGCNALWINPCFESPFNDAGYDVADYYKVAPRYGTNEDLKELFESAHERGIRVLLDLVPGHTSVEHAWFKESLKAEKNEYSGRYIWTDNAWEDVTNVSGIMGSLRGISDRDGSCAVNFFSSQPSLNYGFARVDRLWQKPVDSEEAIASKEAIKEVMRFWLKMGCDGFRVDMAHSMIKNDEDSKATIAFWQEFRTFLDKEFPDAAMVSEWGEPDKALLGGYHMDFLLHFGPSHYNDLFRCENPYFSAAGKGDISQFVEYYKENYAKTKGKGFICIPSGNHDMDRMARYLTQEEMKLAFAFLLSMPGAPFIYYGDEIGMRYVENLTSVEGGFSRTGSRSPMQWDTTTVNDGFSTASKDMLYIQQDPAADRPSVKAQLQNEASLWTEIQRQIKIRGEEQALQADGDIEFLYAEENRYPFVYKRFLGEETIVIVLNPSGKSESVSNDILPSDELKNSKVIYYYGEPAHIEDGKLICPAGSVTYFKYN